MIWFYFFQKEEILRESKKSLRQEVGKKERSAHRKKMRNRSSYEQKEEKSKASDTMDGFLPEKIDYEFFL